MNMPFHSGSPFDDNEDDTVRANEAWRHDPARKAAIKDRIEQRQAAFRKAHDLLRQAAETLGAVDYVPRDEDPLFVRNRDAVGAALRTLDRDAKTVLTEPNDTYLGNKAAFGAPHGWGG